MRRRSLLILSLSLLLIAGCGGGGSNNSGGDPGTPPPTDPTSAKVKLEIQWGARSRVIQGPSSALSASVTLTGAKVGGGDFTFVVNRDTTKTAIHTETYTSVDEAKLGTFPLIVRFYSQANGAGQLRGLAQASATLSADGTLSTIVSTVNTVKTVTVTAGQTLAVNQTKDLLVTARDAAGAVVAVDGGAIFVNVVTGADILRAVIPPTGNLPKITGLRPGSAFVTASIDGISSPAAVVNVTSTTTVTIPSPPTTVIAGDAFDFNAVVTGAPAGENGVVWSIAEGPTGGTIDANGLYTAPSTWTPQTTTKTVTVIATSTYDPIKSAQVTFTVLKDTVITVTPPGPVTVGVRQTVPFIGRAAGTTSTEVDWAVEEGAAGGTITANGLYTAPNVPGTYHVLVTSRSDTSAVKRIVINVQSGDGSVIIR